MSSRARWLGSLDLVRTVLALAVIPLGLGMGLMSLARHRDRRRAANAAYGTWGRLGPAAAGFRLAVEGAEVLEAARPAVFVINHRSGIDPLVVCALLRRDFVGVAKRELALNPLLGPALAFAGTVLVDRSDRPRATGQLDSGVETLARGLSVAVAPEGTRSLAGPLGRFRKGAFRLALAAGVPVVPIVIRNAEAVLPPRAWLMRPGTIEVRVLSPIPTQGWTLEKLDARIAEVEARFHANLGGPGPSR